MEQLSHVQSTPSTAKDHAVRWRDLREWLAVVDDEGRLLRIKQPVDTDEELAAITFMATRRENAPALLFEAPRGDRFGARVLANMLGSSKERYALAAGLDPGLTTAEMIAATRGIMSRRIAPVRVPAATAPVNEIVLQGDDVDLTALPVPKFWPGDGGRYIGTGDITLTRDPVTSRVNVGCYRQMLHGPRRVGLYCSPGKHGLLDREAWWARGEPCEVVVAYGIDPVLFMLAAQVFGANESEFDVAGGIMGRGVELTDGVCVGLPIPAHAELVIEGVLHAGDVEPEGPLAASGWGIVVVSLRQQYAGHAAQVLALAAQCPAAAYYTKWIIAVDDDVDPTDFNEVMWALSTRCHPSEDIDFLRNTWSTGLDPSQFVADERPYGSKALINACKPHRYIKQFPPSTLLRRSVYERVSARWSELGFAEPAPKINAFHPE